MTNEELLQSTLNATVERLGKQATTYEAEIANLNAQIVLLNNRIKQLSEEQTENED